MEDPLVHVICILLVNDSSIHITPTSPYNLAQYQLALHQIDSLRKDGRFVGSDGNIPEGQGIVMAHLNECHELVEMVRMLLCVSGLRFSWLRSA